MFEPIPIAILVALALAASWFATRRRGHLALAGMWLAYAVYEYLMYTRVLCTGECNIRVDLLLFYPVLIGSTLWAAIASIVRTVKRRRHESGDA